MASRKGRLPQIVDVEEMPPPKRGRPNAFDLDPFVEALRDGRPHALESIDGDEDRRFWRRKLRQAARMAGMSVETSYARAERRLYFKGTSAE